MEKNNSRFFTGVPDSVLKGLSSYLQNKDKKISQEIFKILKEEKDKLVFFDEIHQGSGEQSMQGDMLQNLVFDNEYLAFIMVTATFAKPYLKYMNKGDEDTKLLQWRYNDIQLMKDINKFIIDEGYDLNKVKLLSSIIWVNMAPLHEYPFNRFLFNFGKYNLYKTLQND